MIRKQSVFVSYATSHYVRGGRHLVGDRAGQPATFCKDDGRPVFCCWLLLLGGWREDVRNLLLRLRTVAGKSQGNVGGEKEKRQTTCSQLRVVLGLCCQDVIARILSLGNTYMGRKG